MSGIEEAAEGKMHREYDSYEWDELKREANLVKHGIDFEDARAAMAEEHLVLSADRPHEKRWIALAKVDGRLVAVVYTLRDRSCRIISARAARRNERKTYNAHFGA